MLNHETTSIAREAEDEREYFSDVDTSRIKYSRKLKALIYPIHKYLEGGTEYLFKVSKQKPTYMQGGWVATRGDLVFSAYSLSTLKAKVVDYIECAV